jgi:hypothetical protein
MNDQPAPTGPIDGSYSRGLKGKITVPAQGCQQKSNWSSLTRFEQNDNTELNETLYYRQLNVPTRAWSRGFPTLDGSLLKDADDVDLVEYFRLDFEGYIQLPASMPEGDYEFSLLADDGAKLEIDDQAIITSDTVHPTKMLCGNRSIHFARGDRKRIKVAYFQGPRYHIALILQWRLARATAEVECGRSGNDRYFNSSTVPSTPTATYQGLANRGWSVVPVEALSIPEGGNDPSFNPCLSPTVVETFPGVTTNPIINPI